MIAIALVSIACSIFAAWSYFTAQRLNRLHIRVDRTCDALQAALDTRCALLRAIFPQLRALADRAEQVEMSPANVEERVAAERLLLAEYREAAGDCSSDWQDELTRAFLRVELAQRFYNQAVADTRRLRAQRPVRVLRLSGTANLPEFTAGSLS